MPLKVVAAVLVLLLGPPLAGRSTVQWPRFRGPNGAGVADGDRPPVTFGPATKLLWKRPLPPGHSSPVIWDAHIFLTAIEDNALVVLALRRRDGTLLWKQVAPSTDIEAVHAFNSPAASTPATDGQRVYAYFGSYGLLAYDFDGREVWRRPLPLPPTRFGTASSPIAVEGKVILQRDGNSADSELLAVDGRTGDVVWRAPRPLFGESWSTPVIWSHEGRDEIITVGTRRVVAYSLEGVERWSIAGLPSQPITLAVAGDGTLFASSTSPVGSPEDPIEIPTWDELIRSHDRNKDGRLTPDEIPPDAGVHLRPEVAKEASGNFIELSRIFELADGNKDEILTMTEWDGTISRVRSNVNTVLAIRPGGAADSTDTHVLWKAHRGLPEMPSPVYYRGRLYFVRDGGMVTSYAADGTVMLDRQRLGVLGQYAASLVAADGKLYAASETGTVVVFRAGDTLDVLARNDLGESITATPAIAGHNLYIRSRMHLWAFGDQP